MATLYITEYASQGLSHGQGGAVTGVSAGQEPAIAVQTVVIGAGSTQSLAFNPSTRFVRMHADAICSVAFGPNPTATTASTRIAANTTEFFGVEAGHKVAVISNV